MTVLPVLYRPTIIVVMICIATIVNMAQPLSMDVGVGVFRWLPSSSFKDVSGIPGPQSIRFSGSTPSMRGMVRLGADVLEYENLLVGVNMAYMPVSMSYTAQERAPIALPGGGLYLATLQHDISAQMDVFNLAPRLRYRALDWLTAEISAPLQFVLEPKYVQVMRFTDPAGLAFVDGRIEQVTGRGRIANVRRLIPSIAISVNAELPLSANGSVSLLPRLGYVQSLQTVTSDGAFTLLGIDASLGVKIAFKRIDPTQELAAPVTYDSSSIEQSAQDAPVAMLDTRVERDTLVELRTGIAQETTDLVNVIIDTISSQDRLYRRIRETYRTYVPKPPSVLRGSISLRFVDEDGTITNNARLTATRVSSQRIVPIVPMVMFDSTLHQIPDRYVQYTPSEAARFQERRVLATEVHWHYQLLNIVGSRLRSQRTAACQLQLYAPSPDTVLGNMRLRAVQSYIASRFGVRESRIIIIPSSTGLTDDTASDIAASVVISDPTGKLLRPLEGTVDFVEARLPTVRIAPDAISEAGLRQWNVTINHGSTELYALPESAGDVRDVTVDLNDVLTADLAMKQPLSFVLHLQDNEGTTTTSEPAVLKLTSKALRPSERSTPLRRTEILRITASSAMQQQIATVSGQRVVQTPSWAVKGLSEAETILYESGSKVYIQEERQP